MQAVLQAEHGGPEVLRVGQAPLPQLGAGEVLIQIAASAINRADTLQRRGLYPVPAGATTILGLEAAGQVHELGPSTSGRWKKGDRVMALLPGGGNAEYVAVHEDHMMLVPSHMTIQQAAAIPEVWLTAFQLLYFVASLKEGDTVLIHAGGSGVGTAATQLVKQAGGIPIVTAGTEAKLAKARSLGAVEAFNYKEVDFAEKVLEVTEGKGVNIILDCVGGSYVEKNVRAIAVDGTWVLYGLLGGPKVEGAFLGSILRKRIRILGSTLRSRSNEYKAELVRSFTERALPHFSPSSPGEAPVFQPIVDRVFPLQEIAAAHRYMDENKTLGKVLLSVQKTETSPHSEL
ncbi:quinone oxidoreductase PIG3-like [Diadema antillarum]|uniref:quinone oxidoreductase PIG3-like n=1 Tax=Diadema antillarum TaxID=105358 RepID=UPI003A85A92D